MKLETDHDTENYVPYCFRQVRGFLMSPANQMQETGPTFYIIGEDLNV